MLARFDDLLAGGLRKLLDGDPNLEVVAADVEHGRISVVLQGHRPDVAVLNAHQLLEPAEVRELTHAHPETRLVLIASDTSAAECAQALALGASAYLGRDTQARDLLNAIYLASRGMQVTARTHGGQSDPGSGQALLTPRELEVLALLQQGRSNAEIALELHVGVETVRTHARNIFRKLDVSSRHELTARPAAEPFAPSQPAHEQPARRRAASRPASRRRGHGPLPRR